MTMLSPYAAYQQALAAGFKDDPAQHRTALSLQRCYEKLQSGDADVQGVYLWGPVGRGKTWLDGSFSSGFNRACPATA
ncbi:ATPase, putative, partial [Marinobacter sp. ELB17]